AGPAARLDLAEHDEPVRGGHDMRDDDHPLVADRPRQVPFEESLALPVPAIGGPPGPDAQLLRVAPPAELLEVQVVAESDEPTVVDPLGQRRTTPRPAVRGCPQGEEVVVIIALQR